MLPVWRSVIGWLNVGINITTPPSLPKHAPILKSNETGRSGLRFTAYGLMF
jgi:hypothetical protein